MMKSILLSSVFLLCSTICFGQGKSKIKTENIQNIYQLFDVVHNALTRSVIESKETINTIKGLLADEYFTKSDRKILNAEGEKIISNLMLATGKEPNNYSYHYCRIPPEKDQSSTTYSWLNKDHSKIAHLKAKMENGSMRILDLEVPMITEAKHRKQIETMRCTTLTYGPIIRGKRIGLAEQKYAQPVFAYDDSTGFWQEATYLIKSSEGKYEVEFPNKIHKTVSQIAPSSLEVYDEVFYFVDNEWKLFKIKNVNKNKITINTHDFERVVDRKDLRFKIISFIPPDHSTRLMIGN